MKKSLIALAVAGAFAAPAFAATSNVDVYGKLHMSVSVLNDQLEGVGGNENIQVTSNASRIGFKGSEDLGGGLKGIWQIEQTVNLDEGGNTLATRNSFLGLSGGFGTALLGRHDTPTKLLGRAVDPFGDSIGDSRNVLGGGADARPNNVIAYVSPDMTGFNVIAAYVNDETNTTADAEIFDINVTYKNGPFFAGLSYANGDGLGVNTDNEVRVAGSFSFGDAKLVAQYDNWDNVYDGWMLGGTYAMGPITLKANYMAAEQDNCAVCAEASQWNLGADYSLSKRTTAYVMYTATDGENGGSPILGSGAATSDLIPSAAGDNASAFTVGIIHTF